MAYNNNNGNYNNNNGNYNNGGNNNNNPQHKKSGATYSKISKGKHEGLISVNAWRVTKNGLLKASAFPVDRTVHVGGKKGNEFMRYVVTITNTSAGTTQTYWCLMRMDTRVIVIRELGLCITPNGSGVTRSGKRVRGYFGKNFKS